MTPQDLMRSYEKALATQEWRNDVCVTFSTGTFKGKSAVQAAFENNFSIIKDEQYSISNLHWVHRDHDFAVCLYDFSWQGLIDGQAASGAGRGTSTLVATDDVWQILTEHLGPNASG